ncbi:hypothetical protein BDN70DRAFT_79397 [Pholiota conissans]|uniref:Uncharacterized protein n=1 Tax=Pholiota conissans TaxID=109636 RepID=A0A9P5YYA6_9AGAR|nr:hypothetical protein BDN70DRAFT_79397 [Pholiota conissans]
MPRRIVLSLIVASSCSAHPRSTFPVFSLIHEPILTLALTSPQAPSSRAFSYVSPGTPTLFLTCLNTSSEQRKTIEYWL